MQVVVDANILIAVYISEGITAKIFFDKNLELFVPEYVFEEIAEHKEEIIKKVRRADVAEIISAVKETVHVVTLEEITPFLQNVFSPDPDDIQYLALAMKLHCPLWSNDKELKKQNTVEVLSTADVLKRLATTSLSSSARREHPCL